MTDWFDDEPDDGFTPDPNDPYEALMAKMMAAMENAPDPVAEQIAAAPLTFERAQGEVTRLWPGDETIEITRAVASKDNSTIVLTPKFIKDNLRVACMFSEAGKKPGESSAMKLVHAIDKCVDTSSSLRLAADVAVEQDPSNSARRNAILELSKRVREELATPIARRLIDNETQDVKAHLRKHLKFKKDGSEKRSTSSAQEAIKITLRVSKIAIEFGSKAQLKEMVSLITEKSSFLTALSTLPHDRTEISANGLRPRKATACSAGSAIETCNMSLLPQCETDVSTNEELLPRKATACSTSSTIEICSTGDTSRASSTTILRTPGSASWCCRSLARCARRS